MGGVDAPGLIVGGLRPVRPLGLGWGVPRHARLPFYDGAVMYKHFHLQYRTWEENLPARTCRLGDSLAPDIKINGTGTRV